MLDLVYLAVMVGFAVLTWGLLILCDLLSGGGQ